MSGRPLAPCMQPDYRQLSLHKWQLAAVFMTVDEQHRIPLWHTMHKSNEYVLFMSRWIDARAVVGAGFPFLP